MRWPWGSHWKTRDSFPGGAPMRPPVGCWGSRMRPASPGGSVRLVPAPHPVSHSSRQGERGHRSLSPAEPQPGLVAASLPASAGATAQVSRLRPNEPCRSVCVGVCACVPGVFPACFLAHRAGTAHSRVHPGVLSVGAPTAEPARGRASRGGGGPRCSRSSLWAPWKVLEGMARLVVKAGVGRKVGRQGRQRCLAILPGQRRRRECGQGEGRSRREGY